MVLDGIMHGYEKSKKYAMDESVKDYLYYIENEPFYIAPQFSSVKTDSRLSSLNPRFILFSAPGATGKSALAEYIAYTYGALYWNLAKIKLGTNSFAGSILSAVGAPLYSSFIADLNSSDLLLVIDALDEAEVVSGRKMLCEFINDINKSVVSCSRASIFLLARTETAQFIASFCVENAISVMHYEIGFFDKPAAKEFIEKKIDTKEKPLTLADKECVSAYYEAVNRNITPDESISFLGYAPVLEAISAHIKTSNNRMRLISELSGKTDCVSLIMKIMEDLLTREQTQKIIPAFRKNCEEKYPEFADWDKLYSPNEQLVRIIYYIVFGDTKYSNYTLEFLPPQLIDDYQYTLDLFLPQHPFVRTSSQQESSVIDFTGPAFRDYTLSQLILNPESEELAYTYFEESQSKSYFPSQIFFNCYTCISDSTLHTNHVSFVYDSYRAKSTATERPFLHCSIPKDATADECYASFSMISSKRESKSEEILLKIIADKKEMTFTQMTSVSIDAPEFRINVGHPGIDAHIYNSSVVCNELNFSTRNISIESYGADGCLLVANYICGNPTIEVVNAESLKVSASNISEFYRLLPYKYDFEDASTIDITKFSHALRSILMEFRTHKKDTLAKSAERIEYVVVGKSAVKRRVLDYMKAVGILYLFSHLYKVNEDKMQDKRINFTALSRMDTDKLSPAYEDFCKWSRE